MGVRPIRVLFLSDTHLGIDLPLRPRIRVRRRGNDFFRNYRAALHPARIGEADLVVHGGDLLYRSRVPPRLVEMAFAPLFEAADAGAPVYLVPGNHERSRIPYPLLAAHRGIHIFDRPRTFVREVNGVRLALAGFPFHRPGIRQGFSRMLEQTGYRGIDADLRLLCLHEAVEGARVGPHDFTFRNSPDVVRGAEIPGDFAAVLAGHIHRHQVLEFDLAGRRLSAPVLYPGSIERTSFAERGEEKGFLQVDLSPGGAVSWWFRPLPARPMVSIALDVGGITRGELSRKVRAALAGLDPDSIVRLQLHGRPRPGAGRAVAAAELRRIAPASMNVDVPRSFWSRDGSGPAP